MSVSYRVCLALACSCVLAGSALADEPAPATKQLPEVTQIDERRPVGEEAGSEIMECRNIRVTGSRQRKQSCHTRGEWAAMRRNATEAVRDTQQKPTYHFENGGLGEPKPMPGGGN